MFLIWSFAICLARRSGPTLGTNTSTSGFGFHLGSSPPVSKLHTSCKRRSMMYPFPCFSFNPRTVPSLSVILLTTRPSFHVALSFASPLTSPLLLCLVSSHCSLQTAAAFVQEREHTLLWISFEGAVCLSLKISCAQWHSLPLSSPGLPPG